jgi:hypothetical protein
VFATGQLDATYPQNLQVTIFTSPPNPNVLLSTSPTVQGTTSLTFTVPAGTGQAIYYIQSKADPGTATLTATVKKLDGTDAGYNVTPLPVTLASAGFVISGKNGVGMDVDAKVNSTVGLTITAVVLDTTGAPTALEELLRPGLASYSVALTSNNPSFATVTSPVSVPANTSSGSVTVQTGATSGQTAVISITTPTGFSTPSTGNHLGVVIN